MRAAIIFCLSLFFLLLKGNEAVHAVAPRISQGYEFFGENPHNRQHHTPFHKNADVHVQKSSSSIELSYAEENQDDDESTSRKGIINFKQIISFCHAFFTAWYKIPQKLAVTYVEYFSNTLNFKYLFLQVFRI